ncbi:MAG: hypothetical protein K2M51_02290 [Helicobacter sp.]|nr:hypothetical protein [Helicobacter sp.]
MLRTDYAHVPQRFVYVMPCGSNIDVARCGWDARTMSNSRFYFLSLRASVTSVAINKQRIPTQLITPSNTNATIQWQI